MDHHDAPDRLILQQQPNMPVTCFRPAALKSAAEWFVENFPGKVLYAVKANPAAYVVSGLFSHGVRYFDVASLAEVQLVSQLCPGAEMFFMHPVKSRMAIERSYKEYGVRNFVFDTVEELEKIVESTGNADDLTLVLRIAVPNMASDCPLSGKFGASPDDAAAILTKARAVAKRLGLSFHVGSQTIDPKAYSFALSLTAKILKSIPSIKVDAIDVGGGFPSVYPGMTETPPLIDYVDAVRAGMEELPGGMDAYELWCEPGRALVAESCSIVARVELRKDDVLYINDGSFGGMVEAMTMKFCYPVRLIREGAASKAPLKGFSFYGPTCDSVDYMPGPFQLPDDVREGDYIEIGQLGAYGNASRSDFNGFGSIHTITVASPPLATMYGAEKAPAKKRIPA